MPGSAALDIAIGVAFVFLLLSLVCSAASELLESFLKNRARNLERGVKELLQSEGFTADIYNHPLVNSLFRGVYGQSKRLLPSYIPASSFAVALLDLMGKLPGAEADAAASVVAPKSAIPAQVAEAIAIFERTAKGRFDLLQAEVENWFNCTMDRAAGWYKRRAQATILVLGLCAAVFVNVDAIELVMGLSNNPAVRQRLATAAEADASSLNPRNAGAPGAVPPAPVAVGIPIGWAPAANPIEWFGMVYRAAPQHWLGWILTALGISLGAPFWFDLLNRFIVVRSTVKPHEKSEEEKSKDGS